MSARAVIDFANDLKSGVLATIKADGSPHLSATVFAYVDDKLYTTAHPLSFCYRNLRRDSRVSAAFTQRGGKGKTVLLEGRVMEGGKVNKLLNSVVARIESQIGT